MAAWSQIQSVSLIDLKSIGSWKEHSKGLKMSSFASLQRQVSEKIQQRSVEQVEAHKSVSKLY